MNADPRSGGCRARSDEPGHPRTVFDPIGTSAAIVSYPERMDGKIARGVIILNRVDELLGHFPQLKKLFIVVERRGWHGMNDSVLADIKMVEDCSTIEATQQQFPQALIVDVSNADFVDENAFYPLGITPIFDVIQIACWSVRKRIDLLVDAAACIPTVKFLHIGHFENGGTPAELEYRATILQAAQRAKTAITFAFDDRKSNDGLPWNKGTINRWINQAKIGVLTASGEGVNRFKMECLAADRPFLVAADCGATTQKHINARTGRIFNPKPEDLAAAIAETLGRLNHFAPRGYLLEHSGMQISLSKLKQALRTVCQNTDNLYRFDNIYWDGRNEHFRWGPDAIALLRKVLADFAADI